MAGHWPNIDQQIAKVDILKTKIVVSHSRLAISGIVLVMLIFFLSADYFSAAFGQNTPSQAADPSWQKPAAPPAQPAQIKSDQPVAGDQAQTAVPGAQAPASTFDQLMIPGQEAPLPIVVNEPRTTLKERLATKITLDVRDMSVLDVLRFLALKGDFNLVMASTVQGRATFYLKSVSIKDALDIAVLSNKLAYAIESDIVRIMSEADYQTLYGKSFGDKREVEIVHLNYAKPSYVLSALDGVKSTIGQIIIDEDTGNVVLIDTRETIEKMRAVLQTIERPLEPLVYSLQYAKADVTAEKLRSRVDAQAVGTITVDERTNKIMIRALPGRREEVLKLLRDLDAPTKEVLIEVRVLSVVFNPQFDYGIDWTMDLRNSSNPLLRKTTFKNIMLNDATIGSGDNLFSKYGRIATGTFGVTDFAMALRSLKQVSDTKLVSNPKLLVTNGQEARIHVGDTVPYIVSTTSGTGDNAITSEDVRFVDVGLKLNVTPTINDDGYVSMTLRPEISTVSGTIESQGGGIPQVTKTEVETSVMVKDGMTIVLGGLKKEQKIASRKGLPILMDIPVVRKLFSHTSESIESSETVIFITPHIVTGKENNPERRGATVKPPKDYKGEEDPTNDKPQMGIKP